MGRKYWWVLLLMALATALGFDRWTMDINQAYHHSAEKLKREIFVKPDILELSADELLQVIKPLYGLSDAGGYWGETLTAHHKDQLAIEKTTGDVSLFFKRVAEKLVGPSGSYIDDIIRARKKAFMTKLDMETKQRSNSKPNKNPPFSFTGLQVTGDKAKRISHRHLTLTHSHWYQKYFFC